VEELIVSHDLEVERLHGSTLKVGALISADPLRTEHDCP
jgi:hypothetical protein